MHWKPGLTVVAAAVPGLLPLAGQSVGVDAVRVGPAALEAAADPCGAVFLRNYIPELAATSALGYGGSLGLTVEHPLGGWGVAVRGTAGEERGYRWVEGFERQRLTLSLMLRPPRWF